MGNGILGDTEKYYSDNRGFYVFYGMGSLKIILYFDKTNDAIFIVKKTQQVGTGVIKYYIYALV